MAALAGYDGYLLLTSPPSVNLPADFALDDSGDHTTFVTSSSNKQYRYWDQLASFTFQTSPDGSTSWVDTAPASIQYVGGKVTFPTAVTGATPSARVTVGKYFPYAVIANIMKWAFNGERMFQDATVMTATDSSAGSAAKVFAPLLLSGTFSVDKFWVPESSEGYGGDITAGTSLIISGVVYTTGHRYEAYCYNNKFTMNLDITKLVDSPLEFQLSGPIYCV